MPYAGSRIEIFAAFPLNFTVRESHPTRVRGLEIVQTDESVICVRRTLHWCVDLAHPIWMRQIILLCLVFKTHII